MTWRMPLIEPVSRGNDLYPSCGRAHNSESAHVTVILPHVPYLKAQINHRFKVTLYWCCFSRSQKSIVKDMGHSIVPMWIYWSVVSLPLFKFWNTERTKQTNQHETCLSFGDIRLQFYSLFLTSSTLKDSLFKHIINKFTDNENKLAAALIITCSHIS